MKAFRRSDLEEALITLGELLEARAQSFELVVVGGGSLLLQGQLNRTTRDLDAVARIEGGEYVTSVVFEEQLDQVLEALGVDPTDIA